MCLICLFNSSLLRAANKVGLVLFFELFFNSIFHSSVFFIPYVFEDQLDHESHPTKQLCLGRPDGWQQLVAELQAFFRRTGLQIFPTVSLPFVFDPVEKWSCFPLHGILWEVLYKVSIVKNEWTGTLYHIMIHE